jgi:hypothetical protein
MSGTENSPAGTLESRLRLGAGFAAADRPRILAALSALAPHLSGWEHDRSTSRCHGRMPRARTRSSPFKPGLRDGRTSWPPPTSATSIGIAVGTYSSMFTAAPLAIELERYTNAPPPPPRRPATGRSRQTGRRDSSGAVV